MATGESTCFSSVKASSQVKTWRIGFIAKSNCSLLETAKRHKMVVQARQR
jgi:hypothetical protein